LDGRPRVPLRGPDGSALQDHALPPRPVRPDGDVAPGDRGILGVSPPDIPAFNRFGPRSHPLHGVVRDRRARPPVVTPAPVAPTNLDRRRGPGRNRTDDLDFVRVAS